MFKDTIRGTLRINSERGSINSNVGLDSAAETARQANTPEYIRQNFSSSIYEKHLPSGATVMIVDPSGPYADETAMVLAIGPNSLTNNPLKTETIYDLPEDAQHEYWFQITRTMKALCELHPEDCQSVVGMENNVQVYTNQAVRTSRSIGLPHMHVLRIDEATVIPEEWHIDHLEKEQRFLRKGVFACLVRQLEKEFASSTQTHLAATIKNGAPFGYSFVVDNLESMTQISQRMAEHHRAYEKVALDTIAKIVATNHPNLLPVIPQPSYRLILEIIDQQLVATISPEIFSHAGVMEASGIKLDRSPQYQPRISTAERELLHAAIVHQLTS